ncbi:unnamed protein product [Durusdinium trenchii]|uniref:Deacetylase sirtuin-type domain-containing protein n=1 Tax=Durusdinium trenchii TaxID=1381693 RepID=A0ABP0PUA7_9DINO
MSHFITCWCLFGIGAPLATAEVALRFAHDSTSADLELGSKKTGCMITTESFKLTCQAPGDTASSPGDIPNVMKFMIDCKDMDMDAAFEEIAVYSAPVCAKVGSLTYHGEGVDANTCTQTVKNQYDWQMEVVASSENRHQVHWKSRKSELGPSKYRSSVLVSDERLRELSDRPRQTDALMVYEMARFEPKLQSAYCESLPQRDLRLDMYLWKVEPPSPKRRSYLQDLEEAVNYMEIQVNVDELPNETKTIEATVQYSLPLFVPMKFFEQKYMTKILHLPVDMSSHIRLEQWRTGTSSSRHNLLDCLVLSGVRLKVIQDEQALTSTLSCPLCAAPAETTATHRVEALQAVAATKAGRRSVELSMSLELSRSQASVSASCWTPNLTTRPDWRWGTRAATRAAATPRRCEEKEPAPFAPAPEEQLLLQLRVLAAKGIAQYMTERPCQNVVVLCGAGMSTSAGHLAEDGSGRRRIPDFRTPGSGLYDNLQRFNLSQPEDIFDLEFFKQEPGPFYELCKELWPGTYQPTLAHHFIRLHFSRGVLRRCYTQRPGSDRAATMLRTWDTWDFADDVEGYPYATNDLPVQLAALPEDSLERQAGVSPEKIVAAHGNMDEAHVLGTQRVVDIEEFRHAVFKGDDACRKLAEIHGGWVTLGSQGLNGPGVMNGFRKPRVVLFGEDLPDRFWSLQDEGGGTNSFARTSFQDMLIVIGTSLVVEPFASLVGKVSPSAPRLLINREPSGTCDRLHFGFRFLLSNTSNWRDVWFEGGCDEGCQALCDALSWELRSQEE